MKLDEIAYELYYNYNLKTVKIFKSNGLEAYNYYISYDSFKSVKDYPYYKKYYDSAKLVLRKEKLKDIVNERD